MYPVFIITPQRHKCSAHVQISYCTPFVEMFPMPRLVCLVGYIILCAMYATGVSCSDFTKRRLYDHYFICLKCQN